MDAYAIHDHLGSIVSMSFINPDSKLTIRRLAPPGCTVTLVKVPGKVDPRDAASIDALIRQHRIDLASGRLVRIKD